MKQFRFVTGLISIAIPFAPINARAQTYSLYATYATTHLSNVPTGTVYRAATNTNTYQYTNYTASGLGMGATFNFLPLGPVTIGLDLRGSEFSGENGGTFMAGLRAGLKVPATRIRPFLQASLGALGTSTTNTTLLGEGTPLGGTTLTIYRGYTVLGGIDYRLFPHLHARIEAGAGEGFSAGRESLSFYTIDPGLVLHF